MALPLVFLKDAWRTLMRWTRLPGVLLSLLWRPRGAVLAGSRLTGRTDAASAAGRLSTGSDPLDPVAEFNAELEHVFGQRPAAGLFQHSNRHSDQPPEQRLHPQPPPPLDLLQYRNPPRPAV